MTRKKIAYWMFPQGIIEAIFRIRVPIMKMLKGSNSIWRITSTNTKFKDAHKGERCFILATGPSIGKQNLKPLKNEFCIATSMFHLHKSYREIAPKYHVFAPTHSPFDEELPKRNIEGLRKNRCEHSIVFFGVKPYQYSYWNFIERNPEYKIPNMHFINYDHSMALHEFNYNKPFTWDISKTPFIARTVIYTAIQVAVYMGFKEIFLLGCDHDYLQDVNRVTNHHFYQEEDGISDEEHLGGFTTERWFQEYHTRWMEYRLMGEYLSKKGTKIFNATDGGMLDVFPRIKLSEVLP